MKNSIKEWAPEDRPRERLMELGPGALSTVELLAILLRTGCGSATAVDVARSLMEAHENRLRLLFRSSIETMSRTKGIGRAKAVALCAAFELGRRAATNEVPTQPITNASMVADLIVPLVRDLTHETCWVLYLDGARHLIGKEMVSSGGLNATLVDVRMILKHALDKLACEIILVHNHPSGNHRPGKQDKALTRALREASQLVDIRLVDHIVIGGTQYCSFVEEGLL